MAQYKLSEDFAMLTTIPKSKVDDLFEKWMSIICHNIKEQVLEQNSTVEVDIGIGTLFIQVSDEAVKYKFIPCAKFERAVRDALTNEPNDLLIDRVDEVLRERILHTYKDLL